jgi:large subunit ribosomal protein L13
MKLDENRPAIVLDATNAVLGRLASFAAKQALLGKNVHIINAEEAIVVGTKKNIIEEYKIAHKRGGASLKGPNFPKYSDRLMKRTIRGMLHYTHGRGKAAFKRIRCYNGIPNELKSKAPIKMPEKSISHTFMKLKDISKEL